MFIPFLTLVSFEESSFSLLNIYLLRGFMPNTMRWSYINNCIILVWLPNYHRIEISNSGAPLPLPTLETKATVWKLFHLRVNISVMLALPHSITEMQSNPWIYQALFYNFFVSTHLNLPTNAQTTLTKAAELFSLNSRHPLCCPIIFVMLDKSFYHPMLLLRKLQIRKGYRRKF